MNTDFEVRSSDVSAENQKLVGYVVRWNSPSSVLGGEFVEQFSHNAFSDTLANKDDVRALFEHDHTQLLGRTKAGTLQLTQDNVGLRFELTPPDTTLGRDVLELVSRGDISGMSFGFRAKSETWNFDQEPAKRTITSAELVEITVTSIPAYPESSVTVSRRSLELAKNAQYDKKVTALFTRWADLAEVE